MRTRSTTGLPSRGGRWVSRQSNASLSSVCCAVALFLIPGPTAWGQGGTVHQLVTFGQGADDLVLTCARQRYQILPLVYGTRYLFGGQFLNFGGQSKSRIVGVRPDGIVEPGWASGSGFNNSVNTLVVQGNASVLVGGTFTAYNGQPATRLVRLDESGALDAGFIPPALNNPVQCVAV